MRNAPLWRRPVDVAPDGDGHLIAVSPPGPLLPATDETYLHRDLAALSSATDDAITALASRSGVLHPARSVPAELEPVLELVLGEWARGWHADLQNLRRWVATGGAAHIPGRLAPLAVILAAVADATDDERKLIAQAVADELDDQGTTELIQLGWRLIAELAVRSDEVIALRDQAEKLVSVPLGPTATTRALRSAFDLGLRATAQAGIDTSIVRALNRGWLAQVIAQFAVTPGMDAFPLATNEWLSDWRAAAAELREWRDAIRELRTKQGSWMPKAPRRADLLCRLRLRTGMPHVMAERTEPGTIAEPEAFRSELTTLLVRRLDQEGAWPRPGDLTPTCTMGRALWSLWAAVTRRGVPRYCSAAQCRSELPDQAHGNRRLCDAHRSVAARARAAASYERRRHPKSAIADV